MRKSSIILLVLSWVILVSCSSNGSYPKLPDTTPETYAGLAHGVKYLGKDTCAICHKDKFDTFIESEMGRSWRPATLKNSDANFDHPHPLYDPGRNFYYQPFHRGDTLFVKEYRLSGKDTVYSRVEQIDYIVGSGQHTNSHLLEENGYLYQVPMTWYTQDGEWDLPPGFEDGNNSRFERGIELECITCHNAMPEYYPGSDNRFVSIPHGVDCERCHGPGEVHVTKKLAGRQVLGDIDYSIVNPAKLPIDEQFDLCQRCHLQGTAVPVEGKSFQDFKPGMRLSEAINVFIPRYADSLANFRMAAHPDRLRMSKCFIGSHKENSNLKPLTCITCHNPHLSIKELGRSSYNAQCKSCHGAEVESICSEEESVRLTQENNCISCHMPGTGSEDIPHVRITDHFIRKQPKLTEEEVNAQKEFFRLSCRTQEKPSAKIMADGYLTYYEQFKNEPQFLDSAAFFMDKALRTESLAALARPWVRLKYLQVDYPAIVNSVDQLGASEIRDPWTLYRIGEAFYGTGRSLEASVYYELAVNVAPDHLKFRNRLASVYMETGQVDQAHTLLTEILEDNPKFQSARNNLGYAHVLKSEWEPAEEAFLAALELDPDAPMPLANLASLYLNTARSAEARPYAKRLVEIDPGNTDYQMLWNMVK